MKHFPLFQMGALAAAIVCLAPLTTKADEYDKKTIVTFDQPTEVPGIVLQPGKYVIKLLNSSSNRHIAEVMNERMDHLYALTFTSAAERVGPLTDKQNDRILSFYEGKNGEPRAVRRWFWPGDTIGQEFLYPKNQADRIAANTGEKVPEGNLPTVAESGQSLAPDNAKGLTLQSRDQDDATSQSSKASKPFTASAAEPPAVIAQNTPPPQSAVPPAQPAQDDSQNISAVASSNPKPSDATLPQTASYLPLIGLAGLISLAAALLMVSVKRYPSS
jgi:hypothetical protein